MSDPGLTIVNLYRLTGTSEAFGAAIGALVRRVRDEGHPGVLSYRFFVNPGEGTARGVIDYDGPGAWIGHHDIAMGWPEMAALLGVARLEEVTFLGPLTPEIEAWIAASPLTARLRHGNDFVAGFRRQGGDAGAWCGLGPHRGARVRRGRAPWPPGAPRLRPFCPGRARHP